jgi:hypothetical protein
MLGVLHAKRMYDDKKVIILFTHLETTDGPHCVLDGLGLPYVWPDE